MAYEWEDRRWSLWQAVVPDHPWINATDKDADKCRTYIVEAWNREHPDDPKTLADFDFVAPPGNRG